MVVSSMQHHPHHSQGPAPPQHRPSSIVHQQHHAPPPPSQYSSSHSIQSPYQQSSHAQSAQHSQDLPYYAHQSPYSTPGTTSGYTSADTSDMMAAAQMPRPYPPMSYHTPQSNSPASVASPSGHDQHRSIYGQPPSHLQQQPMYYGQQHQYPSLGQQTAPSPYQQHTQHPSMTSQPNMMMSHNQPHMSQHPSQHSQGGMTGSPRTGKMEAQMPPQLHRPPSGPLGTPQQNQNGGQLNTPTGASTPGGINNNAAPGPIPATTPLVVRQDNNGVQWIAFEYSRDRVKMEYTIRCDVESVHTDELPPDFKTENCVYPRACCPKDQYRGNRLQYETECNTVGWALAQLNPSLRGKRGLIQRAVDSWRNSNQDPRLRSRRVRRMAKMNNRKAVQSPHPHMPAPNGPPGMPPQSAMGSGAPPMGKPGMGHMSSGMHHQQHDHHSAGQGGGDEVGEGGEYMDDSHHHHHQAPTGPVSGAGVAADDVRPNHVFTGYPQGAYPSSSAPGPHGHHDGQQHHGMPHGAGPHGHNSTGIAARRQSRDMENPAGLFPDIPEAKKRKFILVEDNKRGCRLRVRVTLEGVDTKEIPDSFRKSSSVFPRSYFPREMQSPPPSATGSRFFQEDLSDDEDVAHDNGMEVEGGRTGRSRGKNTRSETQMVKVPLANGNETEVPIPRTRRGERQTEVKLNDLGYRMAWLQSRVFAGRTVFLQRALDCYRNKSRSAIESVMLDVKTTAPHYETRVGKRRWQERMRRSEKVDDDE